MHLNARSTCRRACSSLHRLQRLCTCRYKAVVTGAIEDDNGVFDGALNGKESVTKYSVVERRFEEDIDRWITLVDLEPLTGRQHQLRKHLVRTPTHGCLVS